jgi:spore maturation protein CgeB
MISIVGYSPDDMYGTHNQSAYFLRGLPLYDTFITTKSFNVDELRRLGARNVLFIGNGFDPDTHKPMHVTPEDRCTFGGAVGFIGAWEKERGSQMLSLAKAGVGVRVWGWQPPKGLFQVKHANLVVEGRPLWGSDYVKAICGFDINLGFLRKQNRDLETTRSIEIPACGAFMLAERTKEHLILFEEGKEAEFFGSTEELISKCKFYLVHEEIRKKIAAAGRIRCLKSGYSNRDRIDAILRQIK